MRANARRRLHGWAGRLPVGWVALVLAVAVPACAPSEAESDGNPLRTHGRSPVESAERFAAVLVALSQGEDPAATSGTVSAQAFFLSHTGVAREDALRVVGVPYPTTAQDLDTCAFHREETRWRLRAVDLADGAIDLLDAGDVVLGFGAIAATLEARYFPEISPSVSGMVHAGAVQVGAATGRRPRPIDIWGDGGGEIAPFRVRVIPPGPFRITRVGGASPRDGRVFLDSWRDLEVRWTEAAESRGTVVVELSRSSFDAVDTVRCLATDDGAFTIPATLAAQIQPHAAVATDRITVRHRVEEPLLLPDVPDGVFLVTREDFVILN